MTTVIEPATSLRERALAALEAVEAKYRQEQAEEAAREAERAARRFAEVRDLVRDKFGIDADWSQAEVMLDGVRLLWREYGRTRHDGYSQPAGIVVLRDCPHCGQLLQSDRCFSLADIGRRIAAFSPDSWHTCRPDTSEDEPAPKPASRSAAERLVDALLDVLNERGVVLDGGTP